MRGARLADLKAVLASRTIADRRERFEAEGRSSVRAVGARMEYGSEIDLSRAAFVHDSALLFGKISLGEGSSIWMNVVMRSEMHEIVIGDYSNIQDFVMVHVGSATPTIVGKHCSITHHVTLHGCRIGDNCLISINATIMDGAVIGENSIVAANTIVPENTVIPPNSIVMGAPGKVRATRDNELANRMNAWLYHGNARGYAAGRHREWSGPEFARAYAAESERLRSEILSRNVT